MSINSTDLTVRINLITICIAEKGNLLAKTLLYGGDCIDEKFSELQIIIAYHNILI